MDTKAVPEAPWSCADTLLKRETVLTGQRQADDDMVDAVLNGRRQYRGTADDKEKPKGIHEGTTD